MVSSDTHSLVHQISLCVLPVLPFFFSGLYFGMSSFPCYSFLSFSLSFSLSLIFTVSCISAVSSSPMPRLLPVLYIQIAVPVNHTHCHGFTLSGSSQLCGRAIRHAFTAAPEYQQWEDVSFRSHLAASTATVALVPQDAILATVTLKLSHTMYSCNADLDVSTYHSNMSYIYNTRSDPLTRVDQ